MWRTQLMLYHRIFTFEVYSIKSSSPTYKSFILAKMLLKWYHRSKLALYTLLQHKIWIGCNWVQLGAIGSQDPVWQTITTTKSTTPLRVDLDSNASLWYALRDVHSLTIRCILTLTLYLALIYRLRRGRGRCNWVQLAKLLRILLKTWKYTFKLRF